MCRTQISPERIPVTKTWVRQTRNAKTASRLRRLCPCFFLWPDSIRAPNPSLNSICGRPRRSRCLGNPASDSATASYVRHARSVYEPQRFTTALAQSQVTSPRKTMSNFQTRLPLGLHLLYRSVKRDEVFVTLATFPGAAVRFIPVLAWHDHKPKNTSDGKILFLHIAKTGGRTMESLCVRACALNRDHGLYRTCVYRNVCNARGVLL